MWASVADASRQDLERLIMRGVNGIITNQPEVLSELLDDIESSRKKETSIPGLSTNEQ